MLHFNYFSSEQKKYLQELADKNDDRLYIIAENYLMMHDIQEMKENIEIMLITSGKTFKQEKPSHNISLAKESKSKPKPQKMSETFTTVLDKMVYQKEITAVERNRFLKMFHDGDGRMIGIWEIYKMDHDYDEFVESIRMFLDSINSAPNSTESIVKKNPKGRRSSKVPKQVGKPKNSSSIIVPQQMSSASEEFEEEEEEEEYEEEQDGEYYGKAPAQPG